MLGFRSLWTTWKKNKPQNTINLRRESSFYCNHLLCYLIWNSSVITVRFLASNINCSILTLSGIQSSAILMWKLHPTTNKPQQNHKPRCFVLRGKCMYLHFNMYLYVKYTYDLYIYIWSKESHIPRSLYIYRYMRLFRSEPLAINTFCNHGCP